MVLNLSSLRAEISVEGKRIRGKVTKTRTSKAGPELMAAISDADVDTTILDMGLFQFHPEKGVREILREVLWKHRAVFKGLGRIKGVQYKIRLVEGAVLVCCPIRRRSPREEEAERVGNLRPHAG